VYPHASGQPQGDCPYGYFFLDIGRANNQAAAQDIYDTEFILVLRRSLCDPDRALYAIAIQYS
jgi:hypothetical protein